MVAGSTYMVRMASQPLREDLDLVEQLSRIRKTLAELDETFAKTRKISQDTKLATPQMFFQGAIAMAALIGAGAALAKLAF